MGAASDGVDFHKQDTIESVNTKFFFPSLHQYHTEPYAPGQQYTGYLYVNPFTKICRGGGDGSFISYYGTPKGMAVWFRWGYDSCSFNHDTMQGGYCYSHNPISSRRPSKTHPAYTLSIVSCLWKSTPSEAAPYITADVSGGGFGHAALPEKRKSMVLLGLVNVCFSDSLRHGIVITEFNCFLYWN